MMMMIMIKNLIILMIILMIFQIIIKMIIKIMILLDFHNLEQIRKKKMNHLPKTQTIM